MGAGLIVAIGAQNAFVLSQSIRKNHHWAVAGLCAVLDVTLIAAGVGGLGMLIASNEWLQRLSALGGALFLIWFGLSSLRSAFQDEVLEASCAGPQSLARVMAGTLAVSLLNPHVYLDTVVLLGAIGGQYAGDARLHFGLGACTASVLWFFSLALAGRAMAPLLLAGPVGSGQQALPFVGPDVLRGRAGQAREFTNPHPALRAQRWGTPPLRAGPHPGDRADCCAVAPDCTVCSVQPPPSALYRWMRLFSRVRRVRTRVCCVP